MKPELIQWLRCPECRGTLEIKADEERGGRIKEGFLICRCRMRYAIHNYIPQFVETNGYTESFVFEWKRHARTQLDSANQNDVSEKMFRSRVDFSMDQLRGKLVLDAGCGMGRYAEVVGRYGGVVIGIDRSSAIDVAFENIGHRDNVYLIQADLFRLPFKEGIFDFIYSYGVLHHTPNAQKAFAQLPPLLKKGGRLSIFVYDNYNKAIVYSSDFWRKLTTRLPRCLLYYVCALSGPLYYLYRLPLIGHVLKGILVISMERDWRWRWLDTFDWYSPKYQSKHTHAEVCRWFEDGGLHDVKIFERGVTLIGTKR